MSIEERLADILDSAKEIDYLGEIDWSNSIAQIKNAFIEEGYVQVPQVELVTRWERGSKPELYTVNGKEVMTGQEFYDRFVREYHMRADWISADPTMGYDAEQDVLLAARLAAGLDK